MTTLWMRPGRINSVSSNSISNRFHNTRPFIIWCSARIIDFNFQIFLCRIVCCHHIRSKHPWNNIKCSNNYTVHIQHTHMPESQPISTNSQGTYNRTYVGQMWPTHQFNSISQQLFFLFLFLRFNKQIPAKMIFQAKENQFVNSSWNGWRLKDWRR